MKYLWLIESLVIIQDILTSAKKSEITSYSNIHIHSYHFKQKSHETHQMLRDAPLQDTSSEIIALTPNGATRIKQISGLPPRRFTSCESLICFNDGKCVWDGLRYGYRCRCPLGYGGDICEKETMVRYPKFPGTGFVSFPVLRGAHKEMTISIRFRPETLNGLVLFSGEFSNGKMDFFSISLTSGHIEFRFDCGTGPAKIQSPAKVTMGRWLTLTVYRDEWDGWLQLNGGPKIVGRSRGLYRRITFRQDLFMGGAPNTTLIGGRTGMPYGFVGCVWSLTINGRPYDMRKATAFVGDAMYGFDVGECSSHICSKVTCENAGQCVTTSPDRHVCKCPFGWTGSHCRDKVKVRVPEFKKHSFLQYPGLRRTVLMYTEIEVVFKPTKPDGLFLYNGYTTDKRGDFISIALVNGSVEFRFDLGTGPAILRSSPVSMDEWHTVKISRTGRGGVMEVDDQSQQESMSPGGYTQLTLLQDLFLGGHTDFDYTSKFLGVDRGFTGCIQKVTINEKPLGLVQEAIDGVNMGSCDHPCTGLPCQHGGQCVPSNNLYMCDCPLGYAGLSCDRTAKKNMHQLKFSGRSFLKFTETNINKRVTGDRFDARLRVRTSLSDGLLLWTSEDEMMGNSDYLSLGLVSGRVVLGYNLGSGEQLITSNKTVDDGKWHTVKAYRVAQIGYLQVDGGKVMKGSSPGALKQLNTNGVLYIGGMKDVAENTLHKFLDGFHGCLADVTFASDIAIGLQQAEGGQNIDSCHKYTEN